MKNAMLVFSLNEDCNAMTFSCLIGKTPVEYHSDSDKVTVSPNQLHSY